MRNAAKTVAAMALALSLTMPLVACGGSTSSSEGSDTPAAEESAAETIDVSSWKTLGDALAAKTDDYATASWDEVYYLSVFDTGEQTVRVIAKMDADTYAKISDLDAAADDYDEAFDKVVSALELESAEDLTDEKLSQDELDAYVGKTGQDLVDDGFAFSSYFMYGGDETGATMDKGYLAYDVTFDVTVPEDQTEDEGAAVMGATVTAIEYAGASDAAVDPMAVE